MTPAPARFAFAVFLLLGSVAWGAPWGDPERVGVQVTRVEGSVLKLDDPPGYMQVQDDRGGTIVLPIARDTPVVDPRAIVHVEDLQPGTRVAVFYTAGPAVERIDRLP